MSSASEVQKKFPLPSAWKENLEQALAMVWRQLELRKCTRAELTKLIDQEVKEGMLTELQERGFLHVYEGFVIFSPEGKKLAQAVVRRHRLAERLLLDVLTVSEDQIDSNACRLEHVISSGVEEAICTLLGHPQACPHGALIPKGSCCDRAVSETKPIVVPLTTLKNGESGKIAYLAPGNRPELHKFIAMGLVPGAEVRVTQSSPAMVVEIGGTLLAMDIDLSRFIFIRKSAMHA